MKQCKARRGANIHIAQIASILGLFAVIRPMATVTAITLHIGKRRVMENLDDI